MNQARELKQKFRSLYGGGDARVYRAPGRVNLIGEPNDSNDAVGEPAAIDCATWDATAPRDDRQVVIHSENFSESAGFDLDERDPVARHHWSDYARGVAIALDQAGYRLRGANL